MFYFCSLGSNIDPASNVCRAVESLAQTFRSLTLSPLIQTEPHGMQTRNPFYNAFFWFESAENADSVKCLFNSIEEQQGRDRTDPHKKTKDRTIDLDILYAGPLCSLAGIQVHDPYLAPLTPILSGQAPHASVISIPFAGKRLGMRILQISHTTDGIRIEQVRYP